MKKLLILSVGLMICAPVFAQDNDIVTPAIKNLVEQADSCYKQGGKDCEIIYKKALSLIENTQKDKPAVIYNKLSYYYFNNNQSDSAKKYIDLSISQSQDPNNIESAINLKANILYSEGHFDEAVKVYIELAKRLEKQKKTDKLAFTYGNIGNLYFSQKDYTNSIVYLHKSFDILEGEKDTTSIGTIAGNIADGYLVLDKDSLAQVWAHKAIEMPNTYSPAEGKILGYTTLGRLFTYLNTDSAVFYINKAIRLAEQSNDKYNLQRSLAFKARIQKNTGNYKEAQKTIESAIELFRATHYRLGLSDALLEAAKISLKNQLYEKSALYFDEYITIGDSLRSKERYQTLGELTTKYETEKKERLLVEQQLVIQQKNAEIRNWLIGGGALLAGLVLLLLQYRRSQRRNLRLIEQENENAVLKAMMNGEERERNRISKDLHDGVGAMLGAAKMSLQSIPFLNEEKKKEQLEKTAQLISNTHTDIRRIAHDLLPVTLEKEGLIAAVAQFAADINETGIIDFQVSNHLPEGFKFPKNMELMLYRVIQELISNVIRHARATQVQVTFIQTNEQIQIEVKDNGVGFTKAKENQGLYSIRERISTIGGTFDIESKEQKGSVIKLTLKT